MTTLLSHLLMKHLVSGKDYTNKTKCIFILYFICDKINQLGKQLQFCKSYWCMVRKGTVDTLLASKDDVLDGVNKARIAKIATAATGLALGGTARGLTVHCNWSCIDSIHIWWVICTLSCWCKCWHW